MVNNSGVIIHKVDYKKGRMHDYDIYKENHPITPKQVVNVFALLDILVQRKTIQNNYRHYLIERRET